MALRADDVDISRDRALVQRFQAGDDAAFDELYRRYHDRLERFCMKRLGDELAAEEVAQEAFTRALGALGDLGGEQRFYPWVSVIAARLCVDHFRRQARSEPYSDANPGAAPGSQEETLVDAVDASLAVAALARLAPRHQHVLHLREVEGWSYQRIADHYGVKVGTVETLLFRARRALRREFRVVDGSGLAAIPLLGRIVHLAARARHRVPAWVPATPSGSTLAAGVAATVTAAAAVAALAVVPGTPPARPALTPPAQVALAPLSRHPVVGDAVPPVAAQAGLVGAPPDGAAAAPASPAAPAPGAAIISSPPPTTGAVAITSTTTLTTSTPTGGGDPTVGPVLNHAATAIPPSVDLPDPAGLAGVTSAISIPPVASVAPVLPLVGPGAAPATPALPLPGPAGDLLHLLLPR